MEFCTSAMTFNDRKPRAARAAKPFWLTRIDRSGWISWGCFAAGLGLACALNPAMVEEIAAHGTGMGLVLGTTVLFLVVVAAIQRTMRLSILANSFGTPNQLVSNGVFAYSRNPIYVAFLLPLASLGIYSLAAAAAAIALYVWAMTRFVIALEERQLLAGFGEAYRAYQAATPRWFWRW